jgi:hypothetical protein
MANINLHILRKPGGYGEVLLPEGRGDEHDTYTCCHCSRIVMVLPDASNVGEWCGMCGALCCQSRRCSPALKGCTPFEKLLEEYERSVMLRGKIQAQLEGGLMNRPASLRN